MWAEREEAKEEEASRSSCGFTHKRRQISPIGMLFFSLWNNYCSVRRRWLGVPWSCELSCQTYDVSLSSPTPSYGVLVKL